MTPQCHESTEIGQLGFKDGVRAYPACIDRPPRNEAKVPGLEPFPVSSRVGLRAQRVGYNTEWNDNTGDTFDPLDNTAAPGETKTYRWYADGGPGMAMLTDITDPQNHVHHGLFGALIIEPAGTSWVNPSNGQPLASGTSAVITHPTCHHRPGGGTGRVGPGRTIAETRRRRPSRSAASTSVTCR